jgi:hypothetical protein
MRTPALLPVCHVCALWLWGLCFSSPGYGAFSFWRGSRFKTPAPSLEVQTKKTLKTLDGLHQQCLGILSTLTPVRGDAPTTVALYHNLSVQNATLEGYFKEFIPLYKRVIRAEAFLAKKTSAHSAGGLDFDLQYSHLPRSPSWQRNEGVWERAWLKYEGHVWKFTIKILNPFRQEFLGKLNRSITLIKTFTAENARLKTPQRVMRHNILIDLLSQLKAYRRQVSEALDLSAETFPLRWHPYHPACLVDMSRHERKRSP